MFDRVTILIRHIDRLTAFGLIAVSLMLLFYWLEARSPVFVLAFAGACVMGSVYGFLQGAWPFGLVEGIWSIVALRRWWMQRRLSLSAARGIATPSRPYYSPTP
jgi:hypothetical protein